MRKTIRNILLFLVKPIVKMGEMIMRSRLIKCYSIDAPNYRDYYPGQRIKYNGRSVWVTHTRSCGGGKVYFRHTPPRLYKAIYNSARWLYMLDVEIDYRLLYRVE